MGESEQSREGSEEVVTDEGPREQMAWKRTEAVLIAGALQTHTHTDACINIHGHTYTHAHMCPHTHAPPLFIVSAAGCGWLVHIFGLQGGPTCPEFTSCSPLCPCLSK